MLHSLPRQSLVIAPAWIGASFCSWDSLLLFKDNSQRVCCKYVLWGGGGQCLATGMSSHTDVCQPFVTDLVGTTTGTVLVLAAFSVLPTRRSQCCAFLEQYFSQQYWRVCQPAVLARHYQKSCLFSVASGAHLTRHVCVLRFSWRDFGFHMLTLCTLTLVFVGLLLKRITALSGCLLFWVGPCVFKKDHSIYRMLLMLGQSRCC